MITTEKVLILNDLTLAKLRCCGLYPEVHGEGICFLCEDIDRAMERIKALPESAL